MLLLLAGALAAQQPAASATITIRGRVLDANGQPLGKAGIAVSSDPDFTTAAAITKPRGRCAADGSFELTIAPTPDQATPTDLLIAAPGKVAFEVPHLEWLMRAAATCHPSRLDLGELCLPDGFTMTGRVRGPDGKPLAGACVHAADCLSPYSWAPMPGFGSRAITNAAGVFVLPGVFAQAMAITVDADGCYQQCLPCVDLAQPLDVQLEASGFVEGTLVDEAGRPTDGFVAPVYEFLGVPGSPVRTQGGTWRLGVTQRCRLFVHGSRGGALGFGMWAGPAAASELLMGPTQGVALRLGATAQTFSIRAVDGAGARVTAIRAAWLDDGFAEQVEEQARYYMSPSGPDGIVPVRPLFGGRSGTGTVFVVADGYAPFSGKGVAWQDGGSYEAKLVPECRVIGRVLDEATGNPFAGALVTCERVRPKALAGEAPRVVPIVTAADGTFTWGGLAAEPCVVTARHPDGTVATSRRVKWKAAGERQEVTLDLPAGVSVGGRLTGATLPPGARMQLVPPPPVELPMLMRWSPADGGFEPPGVGGTVPLVDGAFRFAHRGQGYDQLFLRLPVPPRQGHPLRVLLDKVRTRKDDEVVDIDVGKLLPGAIAGKVTLRGADFPSGRLAVVAIRAGPDDQGWIDPVEQLRRRCWHLAGADGAFRIPALAGRYTLQAIDVATGVVLFRTPDEVEVTAGAVRQQDMGVDVVEVNVRCEAEGRQQLGAERVEVQSADEFGEWEMTLFGGGPHGSPGARLDHASRSARLFLAPGTFRLRVGVGAMVIDGSFAWGSEPAAEETIEAVVGQANDVTLQLPPPAEVPGK